MHSCHIFSKQVELCNDELETFNEVLVLVDFADANLYADNLLVVFQSANDLFFWFLLFPALELNPIFVDNFNSVHVFKLSEYIVLLSQKFNFNMGAKLYATVSCFSESNFLDVTNRVTAQLINDTFEVQVAHRRAIDLLFKVSELHDHGSAIHTNSDWL